jgi:hypothetical protein
MGFAIELRHGSVIGYKDKSFRFCYNIFWYVSTQQMTAIYERFTKKKLSYDAAHKKAGMKYTTMYYAVRLHPLSLGKCIVRFQIYCRA